MIIAFFSYLSVGRVFGKNLGRTEAIRRLKDHGIIKEYPTGGYIIESYPDSMQFTLPQELKTKPLEFWTKEDRMWLNT